jgi:hypothetical protein
MSLGGSSLSLIPDKGSFPLNRSRRQGAVRLSDGLDEAKGNKNKKIEIFAEPSFGCIEVAKHEL